jgi:hypothetical protein
MLGDISQIDKTVLTRAVNAGLKDVKKNTTTGQYPSHVEFTTKDGKRVSFDVTPKVGGTLKKGWHSTATVKSGGGIKKSLENNVEYASYVNDGHRQVNIHGETVGYTEGKHFLERANNVVEKAMIQEFDAEIKRVKEKHGG